MRFKKRKKIYYFLSINNRIASIGIGGLIVFIAMVLVAGIAASVLIQTSDQLERQAMSTGEDTQDEVSAGIRVYEIIGHHNTRTISGTDYKRFHNMSIMVTPRAGASGIDLSETVIAISNGSVKCILSWVTTYSASSSANGLFNTEAAFDLNASEFGIIVVEDRDSSCTRNAPVINEGDKALLTINLSACFNGLESRADVRGMVIVEDGSPGIFLFRTPASTTRTVCELF